MLAGERISSGAEEISLSVNSLLRVVRTGECFWKSVKDLLHGNSHRGPCGLFLSPVQNELVSLEDLERFSGPTLDFDDLVVRELRSWRVSRS